MSPFNPKPIMVPFTRWPACTDRETITLRIWGFTVMFWGNLNRSAFVENEEVALLEKRRRQREAIPEVGTNPVAVSAGQNSLHLEASVDRGDNIRATVR